MKEKVKIIKADISKFEDFYKLFRESLLRGYFLYSPSCSSYMLDIDTPKNELIDALLKGKKILFMAYSDKKAVGYLLTYKQDTGVVFAHWLAVDKKFRNKGIASSLLSYWEQDALKQGAHMLHLWTTENDVSFYKNRGFTMAGLMPDAWCGIDHFLFYKTLRKSDEERFLKDYLKSKTQKV